MRYIRYEKKEGRQGGTCDWGEAIVSGLHDGCENDTMNLVKEMRRTTNDELHHNQHQIETLSSVRVWERELMLINSQGSIGEERVGEVKGLVSYAKAITN